MASKYWYRHVQFGAHYFDLVQDEDGTLRSVCTGPVEGLQNTPVANVTRYFIVPSLSNPTEPHMVTMEPSGSLHCDSKCQGFSFRHKCSHCDEARKFIDGKYSYKGRAREVFTMKSEGTILPATVHTNPDTWETAYSGPILLARLDEIMTPGEIDDFDNLKIEDQEEMLGEIAGIIVLPAVRPTDAR